MTAQLFAAPFLFLSHRLRKILFHCDLSGAARNFLRAAPFISQPRRLWFVFCFSSRLGFGCYFFFVSLKFLAYGGRQNFFACRRFPIKILREAVRAKIRADCLPFLCRGKAFLLQTIFAQPCVLYRYRVIPPKCGRSKKFCSVRHLGLYTKAAARYPRGCRFFTSFYAPLSGNNIHIHHAP